MCPCPRYVTEKCCNNPSHIDIFDSPDHVEELQEHQDLHRRLLGGWGTSLNLNFDVLDATAVVGPIDPSLGGRLTSSGTSIWCEQDGVHLSRDAYRDVAAAITEIASGCGMVDVDDSASNSTDSTKRKQPDSVITLPRGPPIKRGRGSVLPAVGWLRGEAETSGSGGGSKAGAEHGYRAGVEEVPEGEEDEDGEPELEVGDGGVGLGSTRVGSQTTITPSLSVVNTCVYVFLPARSRETNVSLWQDCFFFSHIKRYI
jgi:hypothetical protein